MYKYKGAAPEPIQVRQTNANIGRHNPLKPAGAMRAIAKSPSTMKSNTNHFHECSLLKRRIQYPYPTAKTTTLPIHERLLQSCHLSKRIRQWTPVARTAAAAMIVHQDFPPTRYAT